MEKKKPEKEKKGEVGGRRRFPLEFKEGAVQMLVDGHSAASICARLGLSSPTLLYRWRRELLGRGGAAALSLEGRVRELEGQLRRVEREREILKKALSIFGRDG